MFNIDVLNIVWCNILCTHLLFDFVLTLLKYRLTNAFLEFMYPRSQWNLFISVSFGMGVLFEGFISLARVVTVNAFSRLYCRIFLYFYGLFKFFDCTVFVWGKFVKSSVLWISWSKLIFWCQKNLSRISSLSDFIFLLINCSFH